MRKTLVQQLERNIGRDPLDAPAVDVQDAVLAQDMGWVMEALSSRRATARCLPVAPPR
jgi:hypothetical protein